MFSYHEIFQENNNIRTTCSVYATQYKIYSPLLLENQNDVYLNLLKWLYLVKT